MIQEISHTIGALALPALIIVSAVYVFVDMVGRDFRDFVEQHKQLPKKEEKK